MCWCTSQYFFRTSWFVMFFLSVFSSFFFFFFSFFYIVAFSVCVNISLRFSVCVGVLMVFHCNVLVCDGVLVAVHLAHRPDGSERHVALRVPQDLLLHRVFLHHHHPHPLPQLLPESVSWQEEKRLRRELCLGFYHSITFSP